MTATPRESNVAGTQALLGCDLPVAPATLLAHRVTALQREERDF